MKRNELIQKIIDFYNLETYLEIGVRKKENFNLINIKSKVCVDPFEEATYKVTSDQFFRQNAEKFDLIFIDGNHNGDYAYRDVINSLKCLTPMGIIVCHDCNPISELFQVRVDHPLRIENKIGAWNGTVWRAWVKLRSELNKEMFVVDTDCGLGVIKDGNQKKIDSSYCLMEFVDFRKKFKEILNLITIEEFLQKF